MHWSSYILFLFVTHSLYSFVISHTTATVIITAGCPTKIDSGSPCQFRARCRTTYGIRFSETVIIESAVKPNSIFSENMRKCSEDHKFHNTTFTFALNASADFPTIIISVAGTSKIRMKPPDIFTYSIPLNLSVIPNGEPPPKNSWTVLNGSSSTSQKASKFLTLKAVLQCAPYRLGSSCQTLCQTDKQRLCLTNGSTVCRAGFRGPRCTVRDPCHYAPRCVNGKKCFVVENATICRCPQGWIGDNCSFKDPCVAQSCSNSTKGVPQSKSGAYKCFCLHVSAIKSGSRATEVILCICGAFVVILIALIISFIVWRRRNRRRRLRRAFAEFKLPSEKLLTDSSTIQLACDIYN